MSDEDVRRALEPDKWESPPGRSAFESAAREWWAQRQAGARPPRPKRQDSWVEYDTPGDRPPLDIIDPLSWHGVDPPPRQWLVQDWIPAGFCTSLYGDAGLGKTLLAQQLMTSVATGRPWLGLPVVRQAAIGLFGEDFADELHRRQDAINRAMGLGMADLADMRLIPNVAGDNLLMTFDPDGRGRTTALYDELIAEAQKFGAGLVVIDNLAMAFAGNENIRPQATQFIGALHRMAQAIQGCVVLIAHPSLDGLRNGSGFSGSTAWNAAVRSRLYLTRPPIDDDADTPAAGNERILAREKSNYSAAGDSIQLEWKDGALLPIAPAVSGVLARLTAETAFMACLQALAAQGRSVSDSSNSDRYAPRIMRAMPEASGFLVADLARAMERLFAAGRIRVEQDGPPSKRVRRIVVVTPGREGSP